MIRCLLRPLDVCLFRDGRPFSPDEMLRAAPIGTVPAGSTIFGALRSLLLDHHAIPYSEFAGTAPPGKAAASAVLGLSPTQPGTLAFQGPYLSLHSGSGSLDLISWPADCLRDDYFLTPKLGEADPQRSNLPAPLRELTPVRPYGDGQFKAAKVSDTVGFEDGQSWALATTDSLREYLCLRRSITGVQADQCPTGSETHTGLQREYGTYKAQTGRLYTVEFLRLASFLRLGSDIAFHDVCYAVDLADTDARVFPDEALLSIGGERRPFRFEKCGAPPAGEEELRKSVARHLREECVDREGRVCFRLVLLTPAPFRLGWLPDDLAGCELLGAAVPGSLAVSGWNTRAKTANSTRRMALPGSVYFLRSAASGDPEQAVETVLNRFWRTGRLCDAEKDRNMGFGVTLVGGMAIG